MKLLAASASRMAFPAWLQQMLLMTGEGGAEELAA